MTSLPTFVIALCFRELTDVFDSNKGNDVNEDSEDDQYLPPSCGVKHIILGHTCQFGRDRTDISFGKFACFQDEKVTFARRQTNFNFGYTF